MYKRQVWIRDSEIGDSADVFGHLNAQFDGAEIGRDGEPAADAHHLNAQSDAAATPEFEVAGPVGAEAVGTECVESTEDAGHLNAQSESGEIRSFDSRIPECVSGRGSKVSGENSESLSVEEIPEYVSGRGLKLSSKIPECVSGRSSSDVVDPHSVEVRNDLGNSEGNSVEVDSRILECVSGRMLECVSNEEVRAS